MSSTSFSQPDCIFNCMRYYLPLRILNCISTARRSPISPVCRRGASLRRASLLGAKLRLVALCPGNPHNWQTVWWAFWSRVGPTKGGQRRPTGGNRSGNYTAEITAHRQNNFGQRKQWQCINFKNNNPNTATFLAAKEDAVQSEKLIRPSAYETWMQ